MAYVKPQVLVFQEFTIVPTEITEPLRAHISGPNAILHRHSDPDEKPFCKLGVYDRLNDSCYLWPQRLAGSRIDEGYVKLYADNALLLYYEDLISDVSTVTRAVSGQINWIESVAGTGDNAAPAHFKTNGGYPRSSQFKDRDVQLGDAVYLRSVSADNDCEETELWTYVTGFASETVSAEIEDATRDNANADSQLASAPTPSADNNYLQTAGAENCVKLSVVDASEYDGVEDGVISETYTVEVVNSSIQGCAAARLRVKSASKLDDVAELNPGTFTEDTLDNIFKTGEILIGTRGLKVRFSIDSGDCETAATTAGVTADQFVAGQKWQITVNQEFVAVYAVSNNENSTQAGGYTGDKNDAYIVECTKGGYIEEGGDNFPEIVVKTTKGLDFSGPTEITTSSNTDFFPIGSNGVAVAFVDENGSSVTSMRKGDKWIVKVVSSAAGAVNKLILRHDLPAAMRESDSLDIRLFIKDDIQISRERLGYAPMTNYFLEDTQVCVQEGIIAYHPEWTDSGVEQPLPLWGGDVYVEYREWVSELADQVNAISTPADLDNIKGQLDPDNPLKWGVFKALSNSNGTVVKYTAVANPDDLDSWVQVLERVKGRDDMYNLVPLTFDKQVQDLYVAHALSESNEIENNWKAVVLALPSRPTVPVIAEGATVAGVTGNVISDAVEATVEDNPNATNTQYTLLRTAENGYFITNDVRPGDIVRYNYSIDSFGKTVYSEYVVDQVLSENSLVLYSGLDAPVTTPQRVEVWRNLNRNELADDIAQRAGSFSSRRVVAVWPDRVGSGGRLMPGYFLAAAVGGLVSGVLPHQGLTNVEVGGFDDFTRSYALFNETQLNRLAAAGVWIVTEDRDGTPYTRHALTTDNLDLNRREEMIRRNVDSMSYLFLRRLRPFIGRTNATPAMVDELNYEVTKIINFLTRSGNTAELGSQLIDGTVRILRIHPLLSDRIEIVLDLVVPAPLNNIELHLVV
jgi:hypothetical protein